MNYKWWCENNSFLRDNQPGRKNSFFKRNFRTSKKRKKGHKALFWTAKRDERNGIKITTRKISQQIVSSQVVASGSLMER